MAELLGKSIIGFQQGVGEATIFGINPATGESLQPGYAAASEDELERAAELATGAFATFGKSSGADRAAFLRKIADNIEGIVDDLAALAPQETGLPEGRIRAYGSEFLAALGGLNFTERKGCFFRDKWVWHLSFSIRKYFFSASQPK